VLTTLSAIESRSQLKLHQAKFASAEVLNQRRKGFVLNVSTSHWPHAFSMAGHALPTTPDKDPTVGVIIHDYGYFSPC
jgi:hypothetical protein